MARMSNSRLLLLSTVTFVRHVLDDNDFSSFRIIDQFPADDLIVLPGNETGRAGEVVLPAVSIEIIDRPPSENIGIGEAEKLFSIDFNVQFFGLRKGQAIDVASVVHESLEDMWCRLYDYNDSGYPDTSAQPIARIHFLDVTTFPSSGVVPALRCGYSTRFTAKSSRLPDGIVTSDGFLLVTNDNFVMEIQDE